MLKQQKPAHLPKYVSVVLDQMYIKEVFDKHSGAIIGYADLGDVSDLLDAVESQIENPEWQLQPLAKCMYAGVYECLQVCNIPMCNFQLLAQKEQACFHFFVNFQHV